MRVHVLEASEAKALDRFVAGVPGSPIEQTWAWGELQTRIPGRPEFRVFVVSEGDSLDESKEWLASLLVIRQEMGGGKHWLWAPRGPVFKVGLPEEAAQEAWRLLQEACKNWARLKGDVFLRVEPGILPTSEAGMRFDLEGDRGREEYLPSHTLTLDLTLSEAELLAQMAQKGRYNIKIAGKAGVTVREAKKGDLEAFYAILKETGVRDGFGVHDLAFYEDFMQTLGERARLYIAEHEGRVVGGLLATFFGDRATYYFGASSNEDRKVMAPYLLQWRAITDAKKAGCLSYDFLGIAPEGEAGHALAGVTQFKTRFGGERVHYNGARVFIYRKAWWWFRALAKTISH